MNHIDFQEYIESEKPKKVVLLYHWDTDGLASAALLLNYFKTASPDTAVTLIHPTINNYFLVEREYAAIQNIQPEVIVMVDLNFPLDVIERLEQLAPNVFVFDHHSQTANINRPGVQDITYPGCSQLVSDYLMQPLSLTAVLGMVGDQEERIREFTAFYPQVQEMMKEHDLSFEEVLHITKLFDGMYIVGDTNGLEYAISLLQSNSESALQDKRLQEAQKQIAQELKTASATEMKAVAAGILYMPIESQMSLISEITRQKSRQYPDHIIVTDQARGEDASLYVRRRNADIDLGVVVDFARSKGYNAGGKPEVAGVVLPTVQLAEFRQQVCTLLQTN